MKETPQESLLKLEANKLQKLSIMNRSTIAIIALSIAVAVLLAIVLWPTDTAP